VQHGSSSAWFY